MTIYWSSTLAPRHLFKRAYESPELAAHIRDNSFVDPAILAADLGIESLSAMSVEAYQRRLGVRKINNPRGETMTIIMGIDPGVSGAVAFYFPMVPSRIAVDDVPVAGGEINVAELARLVRIHRPTLAVIERVSAMPGNGAVSMFNFGRSYGDVRGTVGALGIPLHFVTPQKWKKHFGLSADKEQSRLRAIRMFPSAAESFKLKKHDGRAEAALIALYGAEVLDKGIAA